MNESEVAQCFRRPHTGHNNEVGKMDEIEKLELLQEHVNLKGIDFKLEAEMHIHKISRHFD